VGAGISSSEGLVLMAGVSQSNFFGTGNTLSTQINTSQINQVLSVSYTNPYYTDDGVSRGFDIYKRRTNATMISVSQYTSDSVGAGVRYAVPIQEEQMIHYGLSGEQTGIGLTSLSPTRFITYINTYGNTIDNLIGTIGWSRDSRDSAIYTTEGTVQRASTELTVPDLSSQQYYKLTYQHQLFYPLSRGVTLMLNGQTDYASGYGGQTLPFFKNYYGGGVGSVRGYQPSSLGPRDINGNSLGGTMRLITNAELLLPMPGFDKDTSVRISAFLDGGAIYDKDEITAVPASMGMRYATGVALTWISPVGPLKLSYGIAIAPQPQDKLQRFQFTLGTLF
jgi:outer membrane protein insertion porin family